MAKNLYVGSYDDPTQGTTLFTKSMSDDIDLTIRLLYNHLTNVGILVNTDTATTLDDQITLMSDQVNARVISLAPDQVKTIFNFFTDSYFIN